MSEHEWEVDIRVRRNGRLVWRETFAEEGPDPDHALYWAANDLHRAAQSVTGDETLTELKAMYP